MVKATIWIDGREYRAVAEDEPTAFDRLNEKWQRHCDADKDSDRRQLIKLSRHVRYSLG